jgi:redox-sensitive bicupin YhaK (pirin superfamily)
MKRSVTKIIQGQKTSDGAGVNLKRLIGTRQLSDINPFLMLDEFGSDEAVDYLAGFPDHPHRGFQTVTYMLEGKMRHHDNKGHSGVIGPGDVQWMNAGSGLIHSEMPEQTEGKMRGFQLWINLPASEKMSKPDYQELKAEQFPVVSIEGGMVKVIAGDVQGIQGPITASGQPLYVDVSLDVDAEFRQSLSDAHTAFVYVYEGQIRVDGDDGSLSLESGMLGILEDGNDVHIVSERDGSKFILLSAAPIHEPIVRHGPFVMNTQGEIRQAIIDFSEGRF